MHFVIESKDEKEEDMLTLLKKIRGDQTKRK